MIKKESISFYNYVFQTNLFNFKYQKEKILSVTMDRGDLIVFACNTRYYLVTSHSDASNERSKHSSTNKWRKHYVEKRKLYYAIIFCYQLHPPEFFEIFFIALKSRIKHINFLPLATISETILLIHSQKSFMINNCQINHLEQDSR